MKMASFWPHKGASACCQLNVPIKCVQGRAWLLCVAISVAIFDQSITVLCGVRRDKYSVCCAFCAGWAQCPPAMFAAATPTSSSTNWPPPQTANIRRVGFRRCRGVISCARLGLKMEWDDTACCERAPPSGESTAITDCERAAQRRAAVKEDPPTVLTRALVKARSGVQAELRSWVEVKRK